ncbi:MAG: hypothetical protein KF887_07480 [Paracoccaceae bacterium]|nr:MAG: hypothetical protein KF887_07480 [Paracoccaceae bacterium]
MPPDDSPPARPAPVVELRLNGPFSATGPGGVDLTPKPHKARALLALLATADDQRRGRRWIEEHLWSDRGAQQAAGSLRQALVDLRRAFGDWHGVVQADREWVRLEPGTVTVLRDGPGEFLDGITVRDTGFLRWLEGMRQRNGATPATRAADAGGPGTSQQPIVIRCGASALPGSASSLVAEIIAARIATDISDNVTAAIVAPVAGTASPPCDIDVSCSVVEDNGICLALIKVLHLPTGRVLFQKDCRFVGTASSLVGGADLIRVAYEAAERTVGKVPHMLGLGRAATKSAALTQLALHRMFSFDEAQLREADKLMQAAWEVEENPVHLAWRGLLQMVKAIELPQALRPELHDLAESLTRQAGERDTGNATLQALIAQTRAMLFGDAQAAGEAAKAAVEENPRNPYALQAMAVARMLAGDGEAAYRTSLLGRAYAERSAFRHWWEAHHATVCVATGRIDEAIRSAEAATFGAPSLRPAYRYLMSLYAQRGDLMRANSMKEALERLEPGFSIDRMLEDPEYPVRTLRNTGLLKEIRKLR